MQIKNRIQTKNYTSALSDFNFNNLIIGKYYKLTMRGRHTSGASYTASNGDQLILDVLAPAGSDVISTTYRVNIFKATSTSITFSGTNVGNISYLTYSRLEELNNYQETDIF
jgi:hypothetical protein